MASLAQILANQANAKLSTGPRTEQGKQASAANSTTTGLTSAKIFVRPEEQTVFAEFEELMEAELMPVGINQGELFTIILHAAWNIRRCFLLETEIQNEAIAKGLSDALLDDELTRKLDRIYRYKKMHESSHRRAMAELRRQQTENIWRRENQELLEESVLVDTGSILTRLGTRLNTNRREMDNMIHNYINAPLPGEQDSQNEANPILASLRQTGRKP
jgi:hypothetical protein